MKTVSRCRSIATQLRNNGRLVLIGVCVFVLIFWYFEAYHLFFNGCDRWSSFNFEGRAHDDPELIEFIRSKMIFPPSEPLSYQLVHPEKKDFTENGQLGVLQKLFQNKSSSGYFVESGGFTGEDNSPTLYWEREKQWTGLLVEPHPYYYSLLEGKNRRATILHAGISPTNIASTLTFLNDGWGTKIIPPEDRSKYPKSRYFDVPCFPLTSILHAIGNPTIHYFALDIESFELHALRTLDFTALDIHVFMIEYLYLKEGQEGLKRFMETKGYKHFQTVPGDMFFVKTGVEL